MIYEFMAEHTQEFAVVRMCKVLEVSTSGYHAWRRRAVSPREQANRGLLEQIRKVHAESKRDLWQPARACPASASAEWPAAVTGWRA